MRRLLPLISVLMLWAQGPAHAQDQDFDGKVVKSIEFSGLVRLTPEAVKAQMALKEGSPFSRDLLQSDVKLLIDRKIYFTIPKASVTPLDDGVLIRIVGEENARVLEVAFWGLVSYEPEDLRPLIKTVRGGLVDQFTLDVDRQALLDHYRSTGYHYAQVTVDQTRPDTGEGLVIFFRITEGPKVEIGCVTFEGNYSFTKQKLLKVMPKTAEKGFLKEAPFVLEEVQRDVVQLNRFYQGEGYLDARVSLLGWSPSSDFGCVSIRVHVQEGEPYIVRSIRLEGMTRFSPEAFRRRMLTRVGCRYRPGVDLHRDIRDLIKMYENCAYLQVDVRDASTIDIECNRVDVLLRVAEGERNLVGEVIIEGNLETKDSVIRREIDLYTGQPLSKEKFDRAQQKIIRLDYWDQTGPGSMNMEWAKIPTEHYGSFREAFLSFRDTKRDNIKDVIVTVKERDTGSLRFAVGVGSNTGVVGDITYQKDNFDPLDFPERWGDVFDAFTGGGQRLQISVQPGTELSRVYVSYFNPRVNDGEWSFKQDAYYTYAQREDWVEGRAGFATTVGRRLSDNVLAALTLRNEWITSTDVDDDAPQLVKDFEGENLLASLQFGLRYSKLDNYLMPTDGVSLSLTYEHAGLWGDLEFNQVVGTADWFIPILEDEDENWHVLRLKGSAGWAEEFGDTFDIPVYERFFGGGAQSIRGFAYRGIGPMDNGEPYGGKAMWIATAEYSFPVFGTPEPGTPNLRGVFFVDAGTVAVDWTDPGIEDVRLSVGFGVRVVVPFLGPRPVAVDFGFPLLDYEGDEKQLISFSFGYQ